MYRHQQAEQDQAEQQVSAADAQFGQRVGGGQREDDLEADDGDADLYPVQQNADHRDAGEGFGVVFPPGEMRRDQRQADGKHLRLRLERGGEHEQEREQHQHRAEAEHQQAEDAGHV